MPKAVGAERLERNEWDTIWDDRVLKRAFEISGGIPKLSLVETNSVVPDDLKRTRVSMTTKPSTSRG